MYLVNNTENSQAKYKIFYKIIAALQKPDIYLYIFFLSQSQPSTARKTASGNSDGKHRTG